MNYKDHEPAFRKFSSAGRHQHGAMFLNQVHLFLFWHEEILQRQKKNIPSSWSELIFSCSQGISFSRLFTKRQSQNSLIQIQADTGFLKAWWQACCRYRLLKRSASIIKCIVSWWEMIFFKYHLDTFSIKPNKWFWHSYV